MTPPDRSLAEYWPVFGLRLATPRLTLTPLQDDDLVETFDVILAGIHHPDRMPFALAWTDAPRDELVANSLRFYWSTRASCTPQAWTVPFLVRAGGRVVGCAGPRRYRLRRDQDRTNRVVARRGPSGPGLRHRDAFRRCAIRVRPPQGGAGRKRRVRRQPESLRVSAKLGYVDNGTVVVERRPGERAVEQRLTLDPANFVRPGWDVQVRGLPTCRAFFGI